MFVYPSGQLAATPGRWTLSAPRPHVAPLLVYLSGQSATRDAIAYKTDRRLGTAIPGDKWWAGENAPRGAAISYYLKSAATDAKIIIADAITSQEFRSVNVAGGVGLNRWQWNLCSNAPPVPAGGRGAGGGGGGGGGNQCIGNGRIAPVGTYRVSLNVGGKDVATQTLKVLEDIWLNER